MDTTIHGVIQHKRGKVKQYKYTIHYKLKSSYAIKRVIIIIV